MFDSTDGFCLVCRHCGSDPAGPADAWSQTSCIRLDAYTPAKIAERPKKQVSPRRSPTCATIRAGCAAGVLIECGAAFYFVLGSKFGLGPVAARLFGGIALSLGLILTFVVGAAMFTGNKQTVMAGCDGLIGTHAQLCDWDIV